MNVFRSNANKRNNPDHLLSLPLMSSIALSQLPLFDPRRVAIAGVDSHLPAIEHDAMAPQALRARFEIPPIWSPEVVREPIFSERPPMLAAVLIPLVMRGPSGQTPFVLLTQRAAHMKTHSGQVAFPGGKLDATDTSLQAAALREAHEEVGLHPRHVQILGELPVYVTGTAFHVTPVVALVSPDLEIEANTNEVADVFEVPLAFLMNPANHRRHTLDAHGVTRQWFSMPYLERRQKDNGEIEEVDHFIWGATAGMLRNFYRFLAA